MVPLTNAKRTVLTFGGYLMIPTIEIVGVTVHLAAILHMRISRRTVLVRPLVDSDIIVAEIAKKHSIGVMYGLCPYHHAWARKGSFSKKMIHWWKSN